MVKLKKWLLAIFIHFWLIAVSCSDLEELQIFDQDNSDSRSHTSRRLTASQTFAYTGSYQTFTVPVFVTSISVTLSGAGGNCIQPSGNPQCCNGLGASVTYTYSVTPSSTLYVYVGGQGLSGTSGFNGGGTGATTCGMGGGGASDIRTTLDDFNSRVVVAAGGGGCFACSGTPTGANGGAGGCTSGIDGTNAQNSAGGGGSQSTGGHNGGSGGSPGSFGSGGASDASNGGAGGGGYFGGGGASYAAGGGGSSLTPSGGSCTGASRNGTGLVVITFASYPTSQPSCHPSRQPSSQPSRQPTAQPSSQPSGHPSGQPSVHPSSQPSGKPTTQPSLQPSSHPSSQPTCQPSRRPSSQPSGRPSSQPSLQPSRQPTSQPSFQPSGHPSCQPSAQPSGRPSSQPSRRPTCQPSGQPTVQPSMQPTRHPSCQPTLQPSGRPSSQPSQKPTSQPSVQPSKRPSCQPSGKPSTQPSLQPSRQPTAQPSLQPSRLPTSQPSGQPSGHPSSQPSGRPSSQPSRKPSSQPSMQPTRQPTAQPSAQPSRLPSSQPSDQPSSHPSGQPSGRPSSQPSRKPSSQPSMQPSRQPTAQPSAQPSKLPSPRPSVQPSSHPSGQPSGRPSSQPSMQPSRQPTAQPSAQPSGRPSMQPSHCPSVQPSRRPTSQPSGRPSSQPSRQPSDEPSTHPTVQPSGRPSGQPSTRPSAQPSSRPSRQPSSRPSGQPSMQPSGVPTRQPSGHPSSQPSGIPSRQPSGRPSVQPSVQPTEQPTSEPSHHPSSQPSTRPSRQPTCHPSTQPSGFPSEQPSGLPSGQPSTQPSGQPAGLPSGQPTTQPSWQPSSQPTRRPSSQPSRVPTVQPSGHPSGQPSLQPSSQPAGSPSGQPSMQPSLQPTRQPTRHPSSQPSGTPSRQPSGCPSRQPSSQPSRRPSQQPSGRPSTQPSSQPSKQPSSVPTEHPTAQPSARPSRQPSMQPSAHPSSHPSVQPSGHPTEQPSRRPTAQPSRQPSLQPTTQPSRRPSGVPSGKPSTQPSGSPSSQPSSHPTSQPSRQPSTKPSMQPSDVPTSNPSIEPNVRPSSQPSGCPSSHPSRQPTATPSMQPTRLPSNQPSAAPTSQPSTLPSMKPMTKPSAVPSCIPSSLPSQQPSNQPTGSPSGIPSCIPSSQPVVAPSGAPSGQPLGAPSTQPSRIPTSLPTIQPSGLPSSQPTGDPSSQPSSEPSEQPSTHPSSQPSVAPSSGPSTQPSGSPTNQPSCQPSGLPSRQPSLRPSGVPSMQPSSQPSVDPSGSPSSQPSSVPSRQPSGLPSSAPSKQPTSIPSDQPSDCPSSMPSLQPLSRPSMYPKSCPSSQPSGQPSVIPSQQPITSPTSEPTLKDHRTRAPTLSAPPSLKFWLSSVNTTAIEVQAVLSTSGVVYCAAFLSKSPAPTSQSQIMLSAVSAATDRYNGTSVVISGLSALTKYRVYCLAQTPISGITPLVTMLLSAIDFSTACCKTLSMSVSQSTVPANQNTLNFISVSLSSAPSSNLTAILSLKLNNSIVSSSLVPSMLSFTATSSLVAKASLPRLSRGVYQCTLLLSGGSQMEYHYSLPLSASFRVIDSTEAPPAPVLTSAVFSSTGSSILVSFDSNTNKGNTSTIFACSELFEFTCSDVSSCQWISPSSVSVYIATRDECASPGDSFSLLSTAEVLSECSGGACVQSDPAAAVTLTIAAPINPTSPLITQSGPSVIGSCDSLTLDLTGSTGHGGRSWTTFSVLVQDGINIEAIQSFLDSEYQLSPPTAIPASMLSKGSAYGFLVTLCNFLGKCSTLATQVVVLDAVVPVVSFPGQSIRNVLRKDVLVIGSSASVTVCNGFNASSLSYLWTVSVDDEIVPEFVTTSKDASKMRLPEYSLSVGQLYTMTLTAALTSNPLMTSSASVDVFVQTGSIYAVLSSGSSLLLRAGTSAVIDASRSYDEDLQGITGRGAGLLFEWTCTETSPQLSQSCEGILRLSSDLTLEFLSLTALDLMIQNASAVVSVTVTDSDAFRSSSASTVVQVVSSDNPLISVSSSAVNGVINSRQSLILTGVVSLPVNSACNASWTVNDTSLVDLRRAALSPVSVLLVSSNQMTSSNVYLAVAANSLPTLGWSGAFSLTCQLSNSHIASASVTVTVNSCPTPGSFSASQSASDGLVAFAASRWVDSDLPLQYQFGFVSVAGLELLIHAKSEAAVATALIPAGLTANNYSVQIFANIFDCLMNNVTARATVHVFPSAFALPALLNAPSTSVDSVRQLTAYVASVFNTANCSLAPNCTALNRNPCVSTSHTCGECRSGFVGDFGDNNAICANQEEVETLSFHVCQGNSSLCDAPSKSCPISCSGQGVCSYFDVNSRRKVDECRVGNAFCVAECLCDTGHYSDDCSASAEEWNEVLSTRLLVIEKIAGLINREDADEQSVTFWINSISDAAHSPLELSSDAVTLILNVSAAHLSLAVDVEVSPALCLPVLDSLDHAVIATTRNQSLNNVTVVEAVSLVLDRYTSMAISEMVPGQTALSLVYSQFRSTVMMEPLASDAVVVETPLSPLEAVFEAIPAILSLPLSVDTSSQAMTLSLQSLSAAAFVPTLNHSLRSNPVTLKLSQTPCTDCNVTLVLPFTQFLTRSDVHPNPEEYANLTCHFGIESFKNHTCQDNQVVQLFCNGTDDGLKVQQCPFTFRIPVCNVLSDNLTVIKNQCSVVSHSNDSIQCSCPVAGNSRRRLDNSTDDFSYYATDEDGSYSVSYVAMLETVEDSFVSTVLSAEGLNRSTLKGWKVIVTIGAFGALILVALFSANWMDYKEQEDGKKKESKAFLTEKLTSSKSSKSKQSRRREAFIPNRRNSDILHNNQLREWKAIESTLPQVFSSVNLSQKIVRELQQHHRWFGIVYFYCSSFPRVLRVISLTTNIIIMLFVQSLTYKLTNGDDGSCETIRTQWDCVVPRSPYGTGRAKCHWLSESYHCEYSQPSNNIQVVLFVAIFSALVSTPLALLVDWIIHHILAANSSSCGAFWKWKATQVQPAERPVKGVTKVADLENALRSSSLTFGQDRESKFAELVQAQKTLQALTRELQVYRATLDEKQKKEFDTMWGLDGTGNFPVSNNILCRMTVDVKQLLRDDLRSVNLSLQSERDLFQNDLTTDKQKGQRLLFLFQRDLLPGIQGMMLEAKSKRDNILPKSTSLWLKIVAWSFIALMNAGMLFYILLFALNEKAHQQGAWFQSFILWLCLEIFLVSTAIVILTHVLIPLWTMKDVNKIKQTLLNSLRDFREKVASGDGNGVVDDGDEVSLRPATPVSRFNAANFLFVSTQIAKEFPSLKEAQLISRFSTPWPKRSYQHVTDVSKQYSKKLSSVFVSFVILLVYFLTTSIALPPHLQDMIIHSFTTAAVGYTILLHIQLFNIFPLLAFFPLLLLIAIVHFLIKANESTSQQRLFDIKKASRPASVPKSKPAPSPVVKDKNDNVLTTDEFLTDGQVHPRASQYVTRRETIQKGLAVIRAIIDEEDEEGSETKSEHNDGKGHIEVVITNDDDHEDDDDQSINIVDVCETMKNALEKSVTQLINGVVMELSTKEQNRVSAKLKHQKITNFVQSMLDTQASELSRRHSKSTLVSRQVVRGVVQKMIEAKANEITQKQTLHRNVADYVNSLIQTKMNELFPPQSPLNDPEQNWNEGWHDQRSLFDSAQGDLNFDDFFYYDDSYDPSHAFNEPAFDSVFEGADGEFKDDLSYVDSRLVHPYLLEEIPERPSTAYTNWMFEEDSHRSESVGSSDDDEHIQDRNDTEKKQPVSQSARYFGNWVSDVVEDSDEEVEEEKDWSLVFDRATGKVNF